MRYSIYYEVITEFSCIFFDKNPNPFQVDENRLESPVNSEQTQMESAKGKTKVNRDEKQSASKLDEQIDKVKKKMNFQPFSP